MAVLDQIEQFNKGTIFPESYNDTYIATKHICGSSLVIPSDVLAKLKAAISEAGMYFGDDNILEQIVTGLIKGNIILQGPPGTGKTTLAKIICTVFGVEYDEATAIPDWTTYDTIGGLQPSSDDHGHEIIIGKLGQLTESVLHCCNAVTGHDNFAKASQASWLILDELNRCEIDKVFGDLFTAFGSDDITSRKINLWFQNDPNKKEIYIPGRYRIIGAMNNIDKNFVFDISQGLSRRFTFISIMPPTEEHYDTEISNAKKLAAKRVINKLKSFDGKDVTTAYFDEINLESNFKQAEKSLIDFMKHVRYLHAEDDSYLGLPIGTAQIIDLYETVYISTMVAAYLTDTVKQNAIERIIDSAIASRIIPQLDGYDYMKLNAFSMSVSTKAEYSFMAKTKDALTALAR